MAQERLCDSCQQPYTAYRPTSRFCSTRCRVRNGGKPKIRADRPISAPVGADRNGSAGIGPESDGVVADPPSESLAATVLAELAAAGKAGTSAGVAAVKLAELVVSPRTSDAARAGMVRELLRVQADLLRDVRDPADPIDELKRRRDEVIAAANAEPGGEFLHVNSRIHADGFPN